ncbi:metallophosphoesterase family protein [Bacillus pinisoli]|uniref:metallophosphoesterase family protein n=1 Tax=Bacillus pinisoli TaxID=2901866 RepID=UPI0023431156|nr:metallophosphoesterase [Bacillus pinisoli]
MKIIVVSDTHMPKKSKVLPVPLVSALSQADHILHLGDWQSVDLYETLKGFAPVDGVAGNGDPSELIEQFGFCKVVSFQGFRFGLVHGHLGKGKSTEERATRAFLTNSVDVILFGHSHIPINKKKDGIHLFNPGSPTDKRRQPFFSYGVIEIKESLSIRHEYFSKDELVGRK